MKISTRGRYAIRVMLDLAEHNTGEYIPLMDIAKRQEISEKYLEAIVASLSKNGFVRSLRGKGGGYHVYFPYTYMSCICFWVSPVTEFSALVKNTMAS